MNKLIKKIIKDVNINNHGPDSYIIELYSSLDELNFIIIDSILRSYRSKLKVRPHLIIMESCNDNIKQFKNIFTDEELEITIVNDWNNIQSSIKPNTCLISVTGLDHSSYEMYPLSKIGQLALNLNIPIHADITDIYSYDKFNPLINNITVYTSKLGIGAVLCIKNTLVRGYNIQLPINGIHDIIIHLMYKAYDEIFSDFILKKAKIEKKKKYVFNKLNGVVDWAFSDIDLITNVMKFKFKDKNYIYVIDNKFKVSIIDSLR